MERFVKRTDCDVISVRISERKLRSSSTGIHMWLFFQPADEKPLSRFNAFQFQARQSTGSFSRRHGYEPGLARRSEVPLRDHWIAV
jgi:hypothetical protein